MSNRRSLRVEPAVCLAMAGLVWLAGCGGETPVRWNSNGAEPRPAVQPEATGDEETGGKEQTAAAERRDATSAERTDEPTTRLPEVADRSGEGAADRSSPPAEPPAESQGEPAQPVFRPPDVRPRHDASRLAEFGIHTFESKRLRLHTDIDPEIAESLPPFVDSAYEAWEEYFGPLPPNRERTDFQMTGYIIADKELFRRMGLLPGDLPSFTHGRHRGAEFWINDQKSDYYRRHLMIHEATHCFMTIMPDVRTPLWYLEGMAELFGTHRVDADGTVRFRVMPDNKIDFEGLGRIAMVQTAIEEQRFRSLNVMAALPPHSFLETEAYAWSWALCKFLDTHPRYRERFRNLGQHLTGTQFEAAFRKFFEPDVADLHTEWALFVHSLQEGYDIQRAAIDFRAGSTLSAGSEPVRFDLAADRGWQSSGVLVERGNEYEVTATGRFTLAREPVPWISEPQGISFRYFDGRPLGLLVASIRDETPGGEAEAENMLQVIPVGRQARFDAPSTGTLYFRINDSWSELADNTGSVDVRIRRTLAGAE